VAIWVVTATASVLWLRRFSMGPAEWLIRAIAYGRARARRDVSASAG
jgi:uncharacterized protein